MTLAISRLSVPDSNGVFFGCLPKIVLVADLIRELCVALGHPAKLRKCEHMVQNVRFKKPISITCGKCLRLWDIGDEVPEPSVCRADWPSETACAHSIAN